MIQFKSKLLNSCIGTAEKRWTQGKKRNGSGCQTSFFKAQNIHLTAWVTWYSQDSKIFFFHKSFTKSRSYS